MVIFELTDPSFPLKTLVPKLIPNKTKIIFSDSAEDLPLGKAPKAELQAHHYSQPCLLYYPTTALANNDASHSLLLLW